MLEVLFAEPAEDITIAELAKRAQITPDTAGREVARLAKSAIVETRSVGRATFVAANWDLPWARDLRSILLKTVGALGQLSTAFTPLADVEEAYIFGSWARRFEGEAGPPPHDVDVLVVGHISLREIRRAVAGLEVASYTEINPVVVEPAPWRSNRPEPFLAEIRSSPLVAIPLDRN